MRKTFFPFVLFFLLSACAPLYLPKAAQDDLSQITVFEPKKPIHIALVLGGGGAKGLAHLGAIKEMEAAGVRPDLIVGCSAGAIVGALYADEPDLKGIEKTLLCLKKSDLLDTTYFTSRFGVVQGNALEKFMEKHLHSKSFEKLKIPLIVVATDLFTGDSIELCQKEIPIAVRASAAFPGIFKPVLLHGRYLIDGGASSPIPIAIAKKYKPDIIIAIDVSEKLPRTKPKHLLGVGKRALEISYRKFIDLSLSQADIVIKMDFQDVGTFDDRLNYQFYDQGRKKAINALPKIKKKIEEIKNLKETHSVDELLS